MKKIAIRKLNRTLLKKEGTKEVYITGKNVFMSFFDYKDINIIPTKRSDPKAKRIFQDVKFFEKNKSEKTRIFSVTKETNEVRLTGFENYFSEYGVNEVDELVLFAEKTEDSQILYKIDFNKNDNMRVLQKYSVNDSVENYTISYTTNLRGVRTIQLTKKETPEVNFESLYWLWDDSFDSEKWKKIVNNPVRVKFVNQNKIEEKLVKIVETECSIKKILKAQTWSKNEIVLQTKTGYELLEEKDGRWIQADFHNIRNLEIIAFDEWLTISNRDMNTFEYFEGEVL